MRSYPVRSLVKTALLCSLVAAAAGAGCYADPFPSDSTGLSKSEVVGGTVAQSCEFPSTVALYSTHDHSYFCTGTLVGPKVVLTAGHCLKGMSASDVSVIYGYANPNTAPSSARRPISLMKTHPNYTTHASSHIGVSNYDIGVVVLASEIPSAVTTGVLDASLVGDTLTGGTPLEVVGFGIYNWNSQADGVLHKAVVYHTNNNGFELIADDNNTGADTCYGDSGGPAYVQYDNKYWLVGITSRGDGSSTVECGDKGIYTMPSAYASWIVGEVAGAEVDSDGSVSDCDPGTGGAAGAGGSGGDGGTGGGATGGSGGSAGTGGTGGSATGGSGGSAGAGGTGGSATGGSGGSATGGSGGSATGGSGAAAGAGGLGGSAAGDAGAAAGAGGSSPATGGSAGEVSATGGSSDAPAAAEPAGANNDGGCGCSVPRRTSSEYSVLVALGGLVLARSMRRRRG